MTEINEMTELEQMKFHCQHWEGLYSFYTKAKPIIGNTYPFGLIQEHGTLFTTDNSSPLKSDEQLLLKKAIKRIGKMDAVDYMLTLSTPVRIAFYESNPKLKIFHGIIYKKTDDTDTELTWLVINGRIIDLANKVRGIIPKGFTYLGIEIPKEILNKTIMDKGMAIQVDRLNFEYKPNITTIFMKSLPDLIKHYGKNNKK